MNQQVYAGVGMTRYQPDVFYHNSQGVRLSGQCYDGWNPYLQICRTSDVLQC